MILVVGSTGVVGHDTCLRLARRGERVRALVRHTSNPDRVAMLRQSGAEIVFGDLKHPASLAAACQGAEAIVSTATSTAAISRQPGDSIQSVDDEGQMNLVQAAHDAGAKRFIFVSFRHPEGLSEPLTEAKKHIEEGIADLDFTIIRASYFMESWLAPGLGFDYRNASARIYGEGTAPISWVAAGDVAEMCAVAVQHPAAQRAQIDFGGPEPLSLLQVIAIFERLSGKSFRREHIPVEALTAQYNTATDPMQKTFAGLGLGLAHGDAMEMAETQRTFGLELTSVEDYARNVLTN